MRILMVLDNPFPPDVRVENEARSLAGAGHEVRILSLSHDRDRPRIEDLGAGVGVDRVFVERGRGNRMRALAATWSGTDRFVERAILAHHARTPVGAVHVHDLYLAGGGIRAAKRIGVPVVVDLHEHWSRVLDDYAWSSGFPRRWIVGRARWRRYERRWLPQADRVVVVNEAMGADYVASGVPTSRQIAVPNWVSLQGYGSYESDPDRVTWMRERPSIVFVGGLVPNRGLDVAIDAMKTVAEARPDVRLVIVGDGEQRSRLESLARQVTPPGSVYFAGRQPQDEIPGWVAGAAIAIHPMRRTPQTDIALSHKLFQYMLAERPVVVSDCPAMQVVVEESQAGLVIAAGDPDALAQALLTLLEDDATASRLGRNGREAVLSRYNWDRAARPLVQWYDGLSATGVPD